MIALSILGVGIVGAVRVFPVGLHASQRAEHMSRAAIVAERTIEQLKLSDWEQLVEGSATSAEAPFDVTVVIDEPDAEGLTDLSALKRISVTVSWTQEGRQKSLVVVTYVQRPRPTA